MLSTAAVAAVVTGRAVAVKATPKVGALSLLKRKILGGKPRSAPSAHPAAPLHATAPPSHPYGSELSSYPISAEPSCSSQVNGLSPEVRPCGREAHTSSAALSRHKALPPDP